MCHVPMCHPRGARRDSRKNHRCEYKMPIRCLDLCCGTKSVRECLVALYGESGVEYVGVDSNHRASPEILADLATWDYRAELSPGEFDVVWASPPCTDYSTAKGVTRGTWSSRALLRRDAWRCCCTCGPACGLWRTRCTGC